MYISRGYGYPKAPAQTVALYLSSALPWRQQLGKSIGVLSYLPISSKLLQNCHRNNVA